MCCRPRAVPSTPAGRRDALRRAFTLVELMVVIVIIGLLAGVVSFSVRGYLVAAKQNIARSEIAKVCQALDTFYTVFDRYPSNSEGLEALVTPTEKFPEGILNKLPQDPWGNRYQYNHPGRSTPFEVLCLGADEREGGSGADADISSVDLEQARP